MASIGETGNSKGKNKVDSRRSESVGGNLQVRETRNQLIELTSSSSSQGRG